MIQDFHRMISAALGISERQISQTLGLLEDGATIPFISRYRKEATGGLDEVQIEAIQTQYEKLNETAKRKETILNTIQEQGKLTAELQKRIEETWDNTLLEDIYLPYKPKRKTRAEAARQKGLEPLATLLMLQREPHPEERAAGYVKGDVKNVEDALKGARDIIAEHVSEDERAQRICPPRHTDRQGGERQRRGSDQIPRLLRLLRIVEAMQLPPPARHPACRSGRPAESQHQPRR